MNIYDIKKTNNNLLNLLKFIIILNLVLCSSIVFSQVELPVGRYHQTTDDLVIKVKGGYVMAKRTWYDGQWYFNRAWTNLTFEIDSLNGSVKSITRNGEVYTRPANSGTVYNFDERKTIRIIASGYRWQNRKGNWIEYDIAGVIQQYGDRNDVKVSFQYDTTSKQLTGVFDHFGVQVLWYSYYTDGKLKSIRDATPVTPRQVQYFYTGAELIQVTDVNGNTWSYSYANGRLASIVDPDGRPTNISYQANGVTKSITTADGTGLSYAYNYDKNKREYYVAITESSGRVREMWYNKDGDNIRRDVNGVTTETVVRDIKKDTVTNELGQVTIRLYDDFDNLIKTTYPDGNSVSTIYDVIFSNVLTKTNENGVITKYTYDTKGQLLSKIEAFGLPKQRVTEYIPNSYGEVEQVKQVGDAVTLDAIINLAYDNQGNLTTLTDAEANVINFVKYDLMGNSLEWTDSRSKLWKASYDLKGKTIQIINPLSFSRRAEYDGFGNFINYFDEYNKFLTRKFDLNNNLIEIIDPLLNKKQYKYNVKGQLILINDEENKINARQYNNLGNIKIKIDGNNNQISFSYGDTAFGARLSQVSLVTYPTYKMQLKYNNRGRVIKKSNIYDGLTQTSLYKYDAVGNLIEQTAPDGTTIRFEYDGLNRNTSKIDSQLKKTIKTYDNRDNILTVTNENNIAIRIYTYDRNNQKLSVKWPNGTKFSYGYTANGQIETRIDNKGQFTFYIYDDANRLTRKEFYLTATKTTLVKAIDFTYNNANRLTGYNDSVTSSSYTYDVLQRRQSEVINFPGFSKNHSFTYLKNSQLKTYTAPDGITYSYSYDANKQFSGMTIPGEGVITVNQSQWYAPVKTTFPGGNSQNNAFDGLMRIKSISSMDSASNIIQFSNYSYNSDDTINSRETQEGLYSYLYNSVDRITTVKNPDKTTETFSYDFAGNRITNNLTIGNWSYNTANQLQNDTLSSYTYNANGDLETKTTGIVVQRFLYTIDGRLNEVQDTANTTIASYYYDPFGRRLWKEIAGKRTYFMPRNEGIAAEFDSAGTTIQTYDYEPNSDWGTKPILTKTNAGTFYYHRDHLGTPQVLTDKTGTIVWQAKYATFGLAKIGVQKVVSNLRFPGQYFDVETGLHYNYFRYYDPSTGRYLRSDPIDLRGGMNTFEYVFSNPLGYSDPLGLETTIVCRKVQDWAAAFLGAKHCFVVVWHWQTDECGRKFKVVDAQYSLAANRVPFAQGSYNRYTYNEDSKAFSDSNSDFYDIPVPSDMTQEQFDDRVMESGDNYNLPDEYDAKFGPNSNTAADDIVENAGGTVPDIPGAYNQNYGE